MTVVAHQLNFSNPRDLFWLAWGLGTYMPIISTFAKSWLGRIRLQFVQSNCLKQQQQQKHWEKPSGEFSFLKDQPNLASNVGNFRKRLNNDLTCRINFTDDERPGTKLFCPPVFEALIPTGDETLACAETILRRRTPRTLLPPFRQLRSHSISERGVIHLRPHGLRFPASFSHRR